MLSDKDMNSFPEHYFLLWGLSVQSHMRSYLFIFLHDTSRENMCPTVAKALENQALRKKMRGTRVKLHRNCLWDIQVVRANKFSLVKRSELQTLI